MWAMIFEVMAALSFGMAGIWIAGRNLRLTLVNVIIGLIMISCRRDNERRWRAHALRRMNEINDQIDQLIRKLKQGIEKKEHLQQ